MSRRTTVALTGIAIAGALVSSATLLRPALASQNSARPTLLLNVISGKEDLHAVTMAMQLANHGLNDNRNVVLFLNVRGPELASRELSNAFAFGENPPVRKMLADLIANGAQVLVCPACAKVMGVKEDELVAGAKLATRESLFGNLDANAVVFTY